MYRLVIVDDEDIIRKGLAELVDWNNIGYELAACFEDGKEVIDFLENNDADVILTDIKMTEVSGIELAKYVFDNRPEIKVVILSGYKEFDYAKKAIEFKVEYYLLKPTRFDEVYKVFKEIKDKLDMEKLKDMELQRYKDIMPLMQEQFVSDLLIGTIRDAEGIQKRINVLDMNIDSYSYPCCAITLSIDDFDEYIDKKWKYGKDTFKNAIGNFTQQEYNRICFFCTMNSSGQVNILGVSKDITSGDTLRNQIDSWRPYIKQIIEPELDVSIDVHVHNVFDNLNLMAMHGKPLASDCRNQHDGQRDNTDLMLIQRYKMIISKMTDNNFDEAESLIDSIITEAEFLPPVSLKKVLMDLYKLIIDRFEYMLTDLAVIQNKVQAIESDSETIGIAGIKNWVKDWFDSIVQKMRTSKVSPTELLVKKAKQYILENFNKDISLEDVADKVFLNPSYLSRNFKQHTGESFTDFLTRTRIGKAEELLGQRRYKLYEICSMVGYKDSKYFSKVFKLYTGYTPKEYCYKKLLIGDMDDEKN